MNTVIVSDQAELARAEDLKSAARETCNSNGHIRKIYKGRMAA